MIKIIGGSLKRSNIDVATNNITKPTTNRIRENVFNIIQSNLTKEAIVLDLFSGSGALGIEAISRGVDRCTFVEQNPHALKVLQSNIEKLHIQEQAAVVNDSADNYLKFLANSKLIFDIIFLDPPYKYEHSREIVDFIFSRGILAEDGMLVLQRPKLDIIESNFIIKSKTYGENTIYILKHER